MIRKISVEIKRFMKEYVVLSLYYVTFFKVTHTTFFQFIPLLT